MAALAEASAAVEHDKLRSMYSRMCANCPDEDGARVPATPTEEGARRRARPSARPSARGQTAI